MPLYLKVGDGNQADKAVFAKIVKDFLAQWDVEALFVVDSALYSADNLTQLKGMHWLTRVPSTLGEVKHLLAALTDEQFVVAQPGYQVAEVCSDYGQVQQRWVVVQSDERQKSDFVALDKKLTELDGKLGKELSKLCKIEFACEADALGVVAPTTLEAAERFAAGLKYHLMGAVRTIEQSRHTKAGRPARGSRAEKTGVWLLSAEIVRNPTTIEVERHLAGKFILATNVSDSEQLPTTKILAEYKAQQSVERGFCFLKDPLFFTSSVFLKSPEQVEAMAMVMGLCLLGVVAPTTLVYSLGQRQLRQALAQAKATVKNQLKKPTAMPTLRWIFQSFQGRCPNDPQAVHLLEVAGTKQVSNLTQERKQVLHFLPERCRRYYLMA